MKTLLLTLISVSLVNNVVLSQFLGLCPFLGVSKKIETAAAMRNIIIFYSFSNSCKNNNRYSEAYSCSKTSDNTCDEIIMILYIRQSHTKYGTVCCNQW